MIEGSCHCGAVRLTLPEPLPDLGTATATVPPHRWALGLLSPDQVAVHDPDAKLAGYIQGDATLTSWHCARCGCTTMVAARSRAGADGCRLFDPAIWEPLPRRLIDGASW